MPRTVNVNYVTKEVKILLHDSETESLAAATAIAAAESAQEAKDVVVDNLQDSLDAIDAKTETEKTELNSYTETKKTEIATLGQGYVDSASQKVDEANTILAAIRNEYGYPFTAAAAADMTDTTKIYVYTGSETGYTNGDWYYHNGTAWTDGGIYNAVAFTTDPMLTISGAAADAKVVGEKITDLEALTEISGKNLFDSRQFLKASGWTHGTDSEYYGVGTDLKSALGVNSSGLLVYGGYKANTQYAIRLQTYATGSYTGNMLQIIFAYTDSTTSALYINKADSWIDKTLITTADKTVSKIYIGGSYSAAANTIHFRNVQITEGAIQYPYEPYTPTAIDVTARDNVSHLVGTTKNYEKVMDVKCVKGSINYNGNITNSYSKAVTLLPKTVTRIVLSASATGRILCFRDGEYLGKIAVDDTLVKTNTLEYKDFYNEINAAEIFEKYNATNIALEVRDPSSSYITNDSTAIEWFKDNVTVYSIGDEEYDFIPDYYNEQIDTAISNAKTDMGNCGRNGFSFIFTTDNHWNHNAGHSPAIIKHVQEKTEIQDVVLGGDMIDGSADKAHELELLHSVVKKFISPKYRLRYCFGNHDGNTVGQTSYQDRWLSQEEVYMATQMAQKYTSNYADYTERFDYYWDDDNAKTRIIVMDSHIEGINLRTYQRDWFTATMEGTPADYKIIVIMHIWYGASDIALQGQTIFDLVDAFNSTSTGAKVVAMFGGHVHRDEYHETPGGVPLVLTTTDQCTGSTREVVNDQAVDVITVDYKNNVIHCRRIGKGVDREFNLQS